MRRAIACALLRGKRSVEDARETAAQNTVAYNLGRAAPYAERLLFDVPQRGTECGVPQ